LIDSLQCVFHAVSGNVRTMKEPLTFYSILLTYKNCWFVFILFWTHCSCFKYQWLLQYYTVCQVCIFIKRIQCTRKNNWRLQEQTYICIAWNRGELILGHILFFVTEKGTDYCNDVTNPTD